MDARRPLSTAFLENHPHDAARVLEALPAGEAAALLEETEGTGANAVIACMETGAAAACLEQMSPQAAGPLAGRLAPDTCAGILRRTSAEAREAILASMPAETSEPARLLIRSPEGTAGALMDPLVLCVADDVTVGEALDRLRRSPHRALYYLYVLDREGSLVGVVTIRELMTSEHRQPVVSVMRREVEQLSEGMRTEEIVAHPGWRSYHALPVADRNGRFLGAVRYETLRHLEESSSRTRGTDGPLALFLSLSEFYWIGLLGIFSGVEAAVRPAARGEAKGEGHGG